MARRKQFKAEEAAAILTADTNTDISDLELSSEMTLLLLMKLILHQFYQTLTLMILMFLLPAVGQNLMMMTTIQWATL